jgi:hypothetical protein
MLDDVVVATRPVLKVPFEAEAFPDGMRMQAPLATNWNDIPGLPSQ